MKTILDVITDKVGEAFAACGYSETYGRTGISNRPDLCEYQCNGAMAAAKLYKKAPFVIAGEVVEKLSSDTMFEEITCAAPGFINIRVSTEFLAERLNQMAAEERLGCEPEKDPDMIIVDYGGANVAKPLHIGHLRSAIIGESVKRILKFFGNQVIGDVHLGDLGLQMGLVIEELRDRKPDLVYFDESFTGEYPKEPPFTISELEEIYPAASARSKEEESFNIRAHETTLKMQKGDRASCALWRHIMDVSKPDLKRNYDRLHVEFDLWKGESDVQSYIPDMIQDLLQKKVAYESQGAIVVDVAMEGDTKELPPCLIQKSDGAALYATSDLATIVEREKLYQPDRYIYLADKRQDLHFTQVFRTARKAGLVKEDCDIKFIGFGTMNGKDGKPFKTRAGGVMRLETLLEEINQAAYRKIMENQKDSGEVLSEEEAKERASVVGLAALKYGDLSNQASKDYIFDIDRFVAFEGNTGPYILYVIVRIKSIFAKYAETGKKEAEADTIYPARNKSEKALMLVLANLQDVLQAAYKETAPHKICQYIYELSDAFNHFYHDNKIIAEQEEKRQAGWIALLKLTKKTLETCIDLLGFSAPDRM